MTSSFYSFAKVVVTLGSFVARVRQLREGNVLLELMRSRVDFGEFAGGVMKGVI